jgi:hypothetical protein
MPHGDLPHHPEKTEIPRGVGLQYDCRKQLRACFTVPHISSFTHFFIANALFYFCESISTYTQIMCFLNLSHLNTCLHIVSVFLTVDLLQCFTYS